MYDANDYVILKSGGVWRIDEKNGSTLKLIKHESSESKFADIQNNEIIRKIVKKEEIEEVIERIGFITTISAPNSKVQKELYDDYMNKYDEICWVKVIKTIYLRARDQKLFDGEIEYSSRAKEYLHGEISALLEIGIDEVPKYIEDTVSSDLW